MNNKTIYTYGSISMIDLLLVAFIILKIIGVIDWPWIWVFAPLWISFLILLIIVAIMILLFMWLNR